MSDNRLKIGITQGDTNGIGWEVILKTLADSRIAELCTPVVYGSPPPPRRGGAPPWPPGFRCKCIRKVYSRMQRTE